MRFERDGVFDERVESLASFARAMGHPARVMIVQMLASEGTLCCFEIVGRLPLAQATVSQHLRVLEKAGLIERREEGVRCEYGLLGGKLKEFCHAFQLALGTGEQEGKERARQVKTKTKRSRVASVC